MIIAIILILLLVLLILTVCFVLWKIKNNKSETTITDIVSLGDYLSKREFDVGEMHTINKFLTVAVNKKEKRFAIIRNFNPKNPDNAIFVEFPLLFITKIKSTNMSCELTYLNDSNEEILKISPANAEVKKFLHRIFKKVNFSVIEKKYPDTKFDVVTSSDWQCNYIWAFSSSKAIFVYYDIEKQFVSHEINLLKTNLTLDIKYSYFEMSIYNINQQLLAFENEFYDDMFSALISKIKEKYACIMKDILYYDNNNNVVFLSNGINSLQVINLDTVDEVYYLDNKLAFKIIQNEKMINYVASKELINHFQDFVINLNLKQIAHNFNYSSDKLINTSENTKLIIDYTRSRVVYCANLNSLSKFSYYTIAFDSIKDVEYYKNGKNIFIRLYINKKDIIDISCKKSEVAYYILAQIKIILNEQ